MRLGLIPAAIAPYVVRAIGERQARRYFLTAERFERDEARRIGLVHDACAPEALDATRRAMTESLLAGGRAAQAAARPCCARSLAARSTTR